MDDLECRVAAAQYPEGGLVVGMGVGIGLGMLLSPVVVAVAPLVGALPGYDSGRAVRGHRLRWLRASEAGRDATDAAAGAGGDGRDGAVDGGDDTGRPRRRGTATGRGSSRAGRVFGVLALVVGNAISVPIHVLSGSLAGGEGLGVGPAVILAAALAAVPAGVVVLYNALLGSAMPVAGGLYVYISRLTASFWGFLVPWTLPLVIWASLLVLGVPPLLLVPIADELVGLAAFIGLASLTAYFFSAVGLWNLPREFPGHYENAAFVPKRERGLLAAVVAGALATGGSGWSRCSGSPSSVPCWSAGSSSATACIATGSRGGTPPRRSAR
jgi:hypothetical protein